jgi:hypothetical protein
LFSFATLASCGGVTDPIAESGLRVENRTQDSLIISVEGRTAQSDNFAIPIDDATPRVTRDSLPFVLLQNTSGASTRIIAPGDSYIIRANEIGNYDVRLDLIVSIARVRRGYVFYANTLFFTPSQLRAFNARIALRSGQFFPTVLQ